MHAFEAPIPGREIRVPKTIDSPYESIVNYKIIWQKELWKIKTDLFTRGRIRDTSNPCKIHYGGGLTLSLKVPIEIHCTEGCSNNSKWV